MGRRLYRLVYPFSRLFSRPDHESLFRTRPRDDPHRLHRPLDEGAFEICEGSAPSLASDLLLESVWSEDEVTIGEVDPSADRAKPRLKAIRSRLPSDGLIRREVRGIDAQAEELPDRSQRRIGRVSHIWDRKPKPNSERIRL